MAMIEAEEFERRLKQTRDELREEMDRLVAAATNSINSIDPAEFERRLKEVHNDVRSENETLLDGRMKIETVVLRETVENNRGTVCRFMGDGVMAMFGAPIASEHHAIDACEAALEMQQAVQDYANDIEARH